jgi:YhgE/Pip C-terminal domain
MDITDKLSTASIQDSADVRYQLLSICPKLEELSKRLVELRNKLESHSDVEKLLYDISELTFNLESSTRQLQSRMDESILPKIEKYLLNSASLVLETENLVSNTNKDLDILKDLLKRIQEKGQITVDELNEVKAKLPGIQNDIHTLTTKIKDFEATGDIGDMEKILQRDANKEGDFFSTPVVLNTHKVFSVGSYGAAMTPFYSTLSLWVGALLLSALLSTKAKNTDINFSPKEEFWGKYLVFLTFGLIQGFVVCLGDIAVLGVRPKEPVLFVLLGMFYSGVFVMIVYSLVALFGNVGKAIAVVFMVVQLAGSGGTFPIEILPTFFQRVYALLPFTYAISAMREAVAGVMYDTLIKDLAVLSGYFLAFMMFGLKTKKWVNMVSDKLAHKLAESGITGH